LAAVSGSATLPSLAGGANTTFFRVVPDDELQSAALETAALIAANAPWGVRMTKEVMWSQLEVGSLQAGIDLENRTQVLSSMTGDMQEAMTAFLEKRPPRYGNSVPPQE
jgi:enoyl-CoA hydratase